MSNLQRTSDNDGVPYVPVEEIPIEWRPPEHSPRLMSWAPVPIEWFWLLAGGLGKKHEARIATLHEIASRLSLCNNRLRDSYLAWFEPMGPPGMHSHVHYRSPQDPTRRSEVQSAMVVDYEAYLVFLDTALELAARAIGLHAATAIGLPADHEELSWRHLLREAEKPADQRPYWLPSDSARAARQLQRTALYARNKAVVHPNLHYVGLRTDNVGNVTHLRLPFSPADEEDIAELDALWRSKFDVREGVQIGDNPTGWQVVQMLDRISGDLNATERKQLERAREAVGFALPTIASINRELETLLSGICNAISETAAASRTASASGEPQASTE